MCYRPGFGRVIGTFKWPVNPGGHGTCSPGCADLLGRDIRSCSAFCELLDEMQAAAFLDAISTLDELRMSVGLKDGRLVELTAFCEGDGGGRVVSGTVEDVSGLRDEIAALNAREELCRAVAENSPAMLWMGDENAKCVFLNQALRDFWGVDPEDLSTFSWGSTTHPDDLEKLAEPFARAMAEHTAFTVEARYRRADGEYRTLRTEARPRFDREGRFLGMTGVNTDITDRLVAEERTRMLMGELNHRTKNILAVVQAVAHSTARSTEPEEFNRMFSERLRGLAASNDLLLSNDWEGVELAELVQAQLEHLGDRLGNRIDCAGPRLRISSSAAQTLGMALHELSTNSLKYGALGSEAGRVQVCWEHPEQSGIFSLSWLESGLAGVSPPTRKGFGHAVIVDMVAAALDADVNVTFHPSGLEWKLSARSGMWSDLSTGGKEPSRSERFPEAQNSNAFESGG